MGFYLAVLILVLLEIIMNKPPYMLNKMQYVIVQSVEYHQTIVQHILHTIHVLFAAECF